MNNELIDQDDLEELFDDDFDEHVCCFAYPDCDENPLGCRIEMGDDVEMFGYKD